MVFFCFFFFFSWHLKLLTMPIFPSLSWHANCPGYHGLNLPLLFPILADISFCAFFFIPSFSSLHLFMQLTQGWAQDPWNVLLPLGEFINPQGLYTSSLTILSLESPAPYFRLHANSSHSMSSYLLTYHSPPPAAKPTVRERIDTSHKHLS